MSVSAAETHRLAAASVLALLAGICFSTTANGTTREIRPGAEIFVDRFQYACSAGFLLRGSDKHQYMLMSGYCAVYGGGPTPLEPKFDRVYKPGKGPVIRLADKTLVGRVVYAYAQAPFPGDTFSFAVVRLAPGVRGNARVVDLDGPTSAYTAVDDDPTIVEMSGAGGYTVVSRDQTRQGVLVYGADSQTVVWAELAGTSRDAGAPVLIRDNQALGIYSGYTAVQGGDAGSSSRVRHVGTPVFRVGPLLAIAANRLHLTLRIARG